MSRAKLTSLAIATTFCMQSQGFGQEGLNALPAVSTADVKFETASAARNLGFVQEAPSSPSEVVEAQPGVEGTQRTPSLRPQSSAKDTKDATEVAKPKVVEPPITLGELSVPNLSLEDIGTGNVPDDVTTDRLPNPMPLPLGGERGIYLWHTKFWVPGGFCHQPLYFEDAMLERHGHQRFPYLQPFVSAARFYGTVPLAPYKWTLQGPLEERHTLGSFRPGTPAPILRQRLPYDETAIRNQVGAAAAAAVAIP